MSGMDSCQGWIHVRDGFMSVMDSCQKDPAVVYHSQFPEGAGDRVQATGCRRPGAGEFCSWKGTHSSSVACEGIERELNLLPPSIKFTWHANWNTTGYKPEFEAEFKAEFKAPLFVGKIECT